MKIAEGTVECCIPEYDPVNTTMHFKHEMCPNTQVDM